jgi:hypothetical protein
MHLAEVISESKQFDLPQGWEERKTLENQTYYTLGL